MVFGYGGTEFSEVDQLVPRVCPTRCLGNWWGRGMNISPAFRLRFGFGESSVEPKEQRLWAMRWIADFGRVWVWMSEAELRMRKRVLGKGDWSVRGWCKGEYA